MQAPQEALQDADELPAEGLRVLGGLGNAQEQADALGGPSPPSTMEQARGGGGAVEAEAEEQAEAPGGPSPPNTMEPVEAQGGGKAVEEGAQEQADALGGPSPPSTVEQAQGGGGAVEADAQEQAEAPGGPSPPNTMEPAEAQGGGKAVKEGKEADKEEQTQEVSRQEKLSAQAIANRPQAPFLQMQCQEIERFRTCPPFNAISR